MARFIDLDDNDQQADPRSLAENHLRSRSPHDAVLTSHRPPRSNGDGSGRPDSDAEPPRISNAITRAFQCYPIIHEIVSSIDLNTLDSLARTSFLIHDALLQNRSALITSTLRCSNEHVPVDRDETLRYRARAGNWYYMEDGRSFNGKSGHCARDLVGQCRRCGEVICRNCAIKPPAPITLRERHRRLCTGCVQAPIATLAKPPLDPDLPLTSDAVQRSICKCDTEGVWLCQPCGRSIRATDNEYQRIWRWRSHYGEVLGGLGTGIGDGDRGVICGRERDCCNAKEREQEIDCDAEDARDSHVSSWMDLLGTSPSNTPTPDHQNGGQHGGDNPLDTFLHAEDRPPSAQLRSGYERHEIEGIGGVVKRKLVRMVRVGACVPEWDDERGTGKRPLARELGGDRRSFCGWCWRVIPGRDDR